MERVEQELAERREHVEQSEKAPQTPKSEEAAIDTEKARTNVDSSSASVSSTDDNHDGSDANESIKVEATAYTAFCDTGCIGVTATGIDVSNTIYHEGKRIIATDTNVIPLGTDVILTLQDGSRIEATANDTGGAIKGNRIDLLVATVDDAMQFGRQEVSIEIVE